MRVLNFELSYLVTRSAILAVHANNLLLLLDKRALARLKWLSAKRK